MKPSSNLTPRQLLAIWRLHERNFIPVTYPTPLVQIPWVYFEPRSASLFLLFFSTRLSEAKLDSCHTQLISAYYYISEKLMDLSTCVHCSGLSLHYSLSVKFHFNAILPTHIENKSHYTYHRIDRKVTQVKKISIFEIMKRNRFPKN